MPKEHRKRGRREEKKRKLQELADDDNDLDAHQKRPRTAETDGDREHAASAANAAAADDEVDMAVEPNGQDRPFYGLLDEDEQEYFRRADDVLELNQFQDPKERDLFIANVFREADGKELKMACSQSCSRLMERLIYLSAPAQLKLLFRKFSNK
jgi:nucleolar protein 9